MRFSGAKRGENLCLIPLDCQSLSCSLKDIQETHHIFDRWRATKLIDSFAFLAPCLVAFFHHLWTCV